VPLVLIGALAAFRLLPADGPRERGRGFDLAGALTGTGGATLLVFAISQAPERGWLSAQVLVAAALAVALIALFVRIEARSASPLMPLRLLRRRSLVSAFGVIFAFGATLQAVPYFLTLYFQDVLGFSALEGGLAFLGPTLAITAGNAIADRLVARFGTRTALLTGMLVGAAGAALLAVQVSAESSYLAALAGIVVAGLGMGLVFPPMFIAAAAGVDGHEQGSASGMASTALQVGSGAGLAILVGIAASDGLGTTYAVIAAGTLLGAAVAATLPGCSRRAASGAAPPDAAYSSSRS
jgi:predicted MFS family arabinose efflux permease